MTNTWNANPYYDPEACGLKMVDSFELRDESYEFDLVAVWKDEHNQLYWAMDSGCSCPTPFENFHSIESLDKLNNWNYFEETVRGKAVCDPDNFLREIKLAMGR